MMVSDVFSHPEGKWISANGIQVYYRELGQGKPLILLHGATDTHTLWDPFLPDLKDRFRVIIPDSRGHGRTLNPESYLAYSQLADDLAGLIQALYLDSPAIFGYSDGGQAALDFGIRYPDLSGALVLGGLWHRFSRSYQASLQRAGFIGPGQIDFSIFAQEAPGDWEERLRRAHHDPRPAYPRILLSNLAEMWWTPLNYSEADFKGITAPTLIIMGENDEMIPWTQTRELAESIPQAEFILIPGASHADVIVPDGEFLNYVLDFLARQAS